MGKRYERTDEDRARLLNEARKCLERHAHETGASLGQMWAAIELGWAELQDPQWKRTASFRNGFELYAYREASSVTAWSERLVSITHLIIPRSYLDALTALLDAGSSCGISDGRAAAEVIWQDAENARDAAREEMGL